MPVPNLTTLPSMAVRFVIAVCALTLLATAVPGVEQATAAGLGSQISSGRRSQQYYESQMQAQDRQLIAIKRQAKAARRGLKAAKRSTKSTRRALAQAKRIAVARRARARSVTSLFADKADAPKPWRYEKRLVAVRTDLRIAERRRATLSRRLRATQRATRARQYRVSSLRRQQRSAVYRREAAEGALGGLISQMTRLAAARVRTQSTVSLANGSGAFSWPSTGRISQTYGCTGFRLNPPKGSCRHFHDGLDIVDSYGTSIRAAAVGVVAYAGWNPFDEGGRAWIVVVAHPDGFVTRYGHLIPTRRVRAGSLVHTGEVIGKMGSTGNSTGTHLHFELLRGGSTVNPLSYLPSGVLKIRVDKKSTKKGLAKSRRKAKARERAAAKRQAVKERKLAKRAKAKATRRSKAQRVACDVRRADRAGGAGVLRAVAIVSGTDAGTGNCEAAPAPPGIFKAATSVPKPAAAKPAAAKPAAAEPAPPGIFQATTRGVTTDTQSATVPTTPAMLDAARKPSIARAQETATTRGLATQAIATITASFTTAMERRDGPDADAADPTVVRTSVRGTSPIPS